MDPVRSQKASMDYLLPLSTATFQLIATSRKLSEV